MIETMRALFNPRSVAVIGASRDRNTIGREVVHNLIAGGFEGPVYPVNPKAEAIHSIRCSPSISDLPPVDLAVVVVPGPLVVKVVRECGAAGVKALVVLSAGFREAGPEGVAREAELREALLPGMRMVGPNCMGIINTDPKVRLNASFAGTRPIPGNVAFASQSGALGEAILGTAKELGIGLSSFVSLGNKTDVGAEHLLEYWREDPRTSVVLLYLESFGDPRTFAQMARALTEAGKPVVVVKSGRSAAGARATESHTGSLAGRDAAATTLMDQCGVLRVDTVQDLFTVGQALSCQPCPEGRRVAILTNAGGPGIMATDAADRQDLKMAHLSPATVRALEEVLPQEASTANPVDTIATASAETFQRCTAALLADPQVDALLPIFVAPATVDSLAVARGIVGGIEAARAVGAGTKPVLCTFMGGDDHDGARALLKEAGLAVYDFPESAVQALVAMVRVSEWRARPRGKIPAPKLDCKRIAAIFAEAREQGLEWLPGAKALEVLEAAGLPSTRWRSAENVDGVLAAAEALTWPLVLKWDHPKLQHKSDVGAVVVGLEDPEALRSAGEIMKRSMESQGFDSGGSFLLQEHGSAGVETILGATRDPMVGHLLLFGLGGVYVEIMSDICLRVHPITDVDAAAMVAGVRAAPMLEGFRGQPPVNGEVLRTALLQLDALLTAFPEIEEIDVNPFLAAPGLDSKVLDGRIRVGSHQPGE